MAAEWKKILDEFRSGMSGTYLFSTLAQNANSQSISEESSASIARKKKYDDVISAVSSRVITRALNKKEEEEKNGPLKKLQRKMPNAFDDGYDFGDLTKTVFGVLKDAYSESAKPLSMEEDIAPVKPGVYNSSYTNSEDVQKTVKEPFTLGAPVTERGEQKQGFFQKGALADKEDDKRIAKAILGSSGDVGSNFLTGMSGGLENMLLGASQFVAPFEAGFQNQNSLGLNYQFDIADYREKQAANAELIKKGLWDEEWLGRTLIDAPLASIGVDTTGDSVFGARSDGLARSAGQLVGSKLLGPFGNASIFLSAAGGEAKEALDNGASSDEALVSSVISGAGELLSEKMSGAIKFGGSALDDKLVKSIGSVVKNRAGKFLAKLGIDAAGEGLEEIVSGSISAVGKKLTYMDDKQFKEIFSGEEALNSFVDGAIMGLLFGSFDSVKETVRGNDVTTGLSKNEQKAVDTVFKNAVAEAKAKNGGKVSPSERVKLYQNALNSIDKGYISIEAIEEALGGDSYERYKNVSDQAKAVSDELERLGKLERYTLEDQSRYAELKASQQDLNKAVQDAKKKLETDTYAIAKDSRLVESYNERTRRGQAFDADLTKYDAKQRAVVQKAIDSGILNNTNRTHEFVDLISRISADKDVPFDFINNVKLKESGFAVDGKQVNGLVTKDGIMLNIDSAKAMNAVVGHEIMHVLKGTEHFKYLTEAAYNCAISKDGLENFNKRLKATEELYKGMDADPNEELAADLIGEYLFTDTDFISRLSTENRNVFQKIYDEIKYLCKVVTAGSKEARELEKVKKAFEEAYREGGKTQGETKYSISEIVDQSQKSYGVGVHLDSTLLDNLSPEERLGMVKEYVKELGGESFTAYDPNGSAVDIFIAKPNARFKNQGGKNVPVNKDLTTKFIGNEVKQEAIALIDELIVTSEFEGSKTSKYPHGWLDNNGQNNWEYWTTYIQDKNNTIWEATLNVANSANGEKILYDISPIKKVGQSVKSDTIPTNTSVSLNGDGVKYSVPGTDGDPVITEQQNERGQNAVSNDMDIAPVRSLSNDGQQHTPDSLSALRLDAPVSSEAELPYGAPIAEAYTVGAKNATTTKESAKPVSQMTGDDIAPLIDSKFDAPTAEYLAEVAKKETIAKNTEIAVLRQAAENTAELDLSEKEQNSLGIFREKLEKLDSLQAKYEEIRGKEGMFTADDLDAISRYQKQIDVLHNNLWEYSQNPILKSVSQKARELLREQYGTIPAGENHVRAAELPAKTNKTNRVSKTASTAIEAGVTTDAVAEQIRQKAVEGEYSYLPITDESAKQRADETIRRKGWDDALTDWRANMRNSAFPGKDMVTLGFQLYNNAVNAGDTKTALHILTDITNTVRNSAQVVQAVRILKQLSPDDRLYAIRRQLDTIQDDLNKRYGEKAPQIDMNSALAENYLNAQGEEAIRAAEDALFRDIAEQLPNTFADKWNSWRYLSMLGNIRTHVRNVLGNVGFAPVRSIKEWIAYGMEAGVNAISPDGIARTKGKLFVHSEADRALYSAGLIDYHTAENLIGSANLKSGDSISRIEQMRPAFGGDKAIWRVLSKVAEMNSNALSSEDMIFKKTTYASAFGGYLKANGITAEMIQSGKVSDSVLDKARVYAFDEALKATYNDFNDFSNFVAKLGNLRSSENKAVKTAGLLVEGVLPFKRTPANIVARSVEYSPVGMLKGIKQCLFDVRSGKVTAAEAIDSVASGLTGTILLGLGALLANMGLVSGGDDEDEKQRQFDKLRGEQSYALKAFGKSYTIDWLAPEVIPMFIGVELYERMNRSGELRFKDILDSIARVSNPLLEMSCLSSLNDLLDSISYSDNKLYSVFSQAAASYVLQALPTVFGQIERIGEPYREQTYLSDDSQLPKDMQQTIAKAANKIPGVEYRQIPYIDAYGRRQETGGIGTRVFGNMLSPGYSGTDRSAPWDDELQRLYDLGYSSVLPPTAAKKIGDKVLSAEEYIQYATFTGQERYRLLGEVTESDYYRKSSDVDKEAILQDLYSYVNAEGSKKMLPDREVSKWTEKAMEMEKIGVPFAEFLRMKNTAVNENGNFTKDTCVAYIKKNFPASKRKAVWDIMKNPSWNDAW